MKNLTGLEGNDWKHNTHLMSCAIPNHPYQTNLKIPFIQDQPNQLNQTLRTKEERNSVHGCD